MSIEQALESLGAALADADVPLWQPRETSDELDALVEELAPLRVPEPVCAFWRRVDVRTLRVQPFPGFCTPEFALESWREARDAFSAFQPLALVNVGYSSHVCLSVELDCDGTEGGALFEWAVDDPYGGFRRRFNGLSEWLERLAALITSGSYRRLDGDRGPWLLVPGPDGMDTERSRVPRPHPVYGAVGHFGGDILDWPAHWQRANGLRP
jgi:hypothetical protein